MFLGEHIALVDFVNVLQRRGLLAAGEYAVVAVDDEIYDPSAATITHAGEGSFALEYYFYSKTSRYEIDRPKWHKMVGVLSLVERTVTQMQLPEHIYKYIYLFLLAVSLAKLSCNDRCRQEITIKNVWDDTCQNSLICVI